MSKLILFFLILFLSLNTIAQPRLRPTQWATPVIGSELDNFYKISENLYRSEQPNYDSFKQIQELGITSILNLRNHHSDINDIGDAKLTLNHVKMNAGSMTQEHIFQALYRIQQSKGPTVVHCWHGSDRTGTVVAAYRIIYQDWSKADAIDEFKNGGYGFHETFYSNLIVLLNALDVNKLKTKLGLITNDI